MIYLITWGKFLANLLQIGEHSLSDFMVNYKTCSKQHWNSIISLQGGIYFGSAFYTM